MGQTAKYALSGLFRNSFLAVFFTLALAANGFSQSENASARLENSAISSNFSKLSITAYQENSLLKVKDFYQYLELLADQTQSEALKNQLVMTIFGIFQDRNTPVIDFTAVNQKKIPLQELLSKIRNSNLSFTVKNETASQEIARNYWIDSYVLEIFSDVGKTTVAVRQSIGFAAGEKQFGAVSKTVWQTRLGEMQ